MKKLIRAIRLRLAYWHRKRFIKLMAKALGVERDINILLSCITYANTDSCKGGSK